jgi:Tol biopolymer transport system component
VIQRLVECVERTAATRSGAALLLLALALVAGSGCDTSPVKEPTDTGVVWTRITDAATLDNPFFPEWRGDSIVFEFFNTSGKSRLAIMHESGAGVRFLTGGGVNTNDRYARWVNDDILVFTSTRAGAGTFDLWYRTLSTDVARIFTAFTTGEWDPAPQPGLPGLAYTEGPGPISGRITLLPDTAASLSTRIFLTNNTTNAGEVGWNPAGNLICFTADSTGGSRHVWVASLAPGDTTLTQLTTGPYQDSFPHFSPDGSKIYFISDRMGRSGVWWVSTSGEGTGLDVVALEDPGAVIATLSPSPDGTRIAVSSDGRGFGRAIWILSNLP